MWTDGLKIAACILGVVLPARAAPERIRVLGVQQEGKIHMRASQAAVQRLVRMGELVSPLWVGANSCRPEDLDCLVRLGRELGAALWYRARSRRLASPTAIP